MSTLITPRASLDRTEKSDTSAYRLCWWLLGYARRRWAPLLAVITTMLLKIGLDLLKPWPMKVLVDHGLSDKPLTPWIATVVAWLPGTATRESLVAWSAAATVVLFLLGWLLGVATSYANIGFGQRMVYDLAADLFAQLQRLSLRFHARRAVGDNIRRVTADCGCVSVIVKDALLPLVTATVSLIAMFAVLWRMDALLSLLSLAVIPWMVLVLRHYMQPMLKRSWQQQEVEGEIYSVVEQTFSAIPVIQAFGREDHADQRFRKITNAATKAALGVSDVQLRFKVLTNLATTLGTAAILWFGTQRVLEGRLTVGEILVFLAYLGALYGPLQVLMYTPSTTQGAAGSAQRVLEILETRRDVDDRVGARELPPVRGHVTFENITFGYDPGTTVLHDVSFEGTPGEVIAVVGPTGAGKSTLVSLIPRFHDPWNGRVLIDGHDIRDVQLRSLRAQIAVVLQEAFLFPITVAENIAYGRPLASPEEIVEAARAANAHAFIERLPLGYQTIVGERGATLSGGERQRISIARAFLRNAPILILDEPTSALDAETEALLLQALDRLMTGRTTFIIAHRLSTIRNAHKILVLDSGRIVETGTHSELLARNGQYARFHRIQWGDE